MTICLRRREDGVNLGGQWEGNIGNLERCTEEKWEDGKNAE